jgi:hypothetical protein
MNNCSLLIEVIPKPAHIFGTASHFSHFFKRELAGVPVARPVSNHCFPLFPPFLKKRSFFHAFYDFLPSE